MSTHTPGPWAADSEEALKIKDAAGNSIALVMWTHLHGRRTEAEVIANADLIAAAPDMAAKVARLEEVNAKLVEACSAALREVEPASHLYNHGGPQSSLPAILRAALAAAKEQQ